MLVSVIVVNWNTRELLEQLLHSLDRQVDQPSYEVVVVDNGSSDGSADMVRTQWPQVKLVTLPRNVGFAAGNNAGFRHAAGEYLLLLNSDTIVMPTTLPGLVSVLRRHPEVGCVGARHFNIDGSLQRSTNAFPTLVNDFLELTELSRLRPVQCLLRLRFPWWGDHASTFNTGWVNGACMMVRRQVIEEVGGLDETFFAYVEEVDWCYRMHQRGWRVVFTPDAEIIHLSGRSLCRDPARRLHLRYWGHCAFYGKHYSKGAAISFRGIVTAVAAGRIVALALLRVARRLGYRPPERLWEAVAQEPHTGGDRAIMRAWWRILCHARVLQSRAGEQDA